MMPTTKYLSFLFPLLFLAACSAAYKSGDWAQPDTVQEVWHAHPDRLRPLFDALDLESTGLASIRVLLAGGDTIGAGEALVDYYRQADRNWVTGTLDPLPDAEALRQADGLLSDSLTIGIITDRIPRSPAGGWQWDYTGPEGDDEFGYSLNGHQYLPVLPAAYEKTGRSEYVAAFDRIITDWIVHHPLPPAGDSIYLVLDHSQNLDWRDIGEVEWRTLETGNRLGTSWPQLFYAFQQQDAFSAAARLLMLSSIGEQAAYLRQYHKIGHNWTTMEMNGLALAGLAFPEFRLAEDWVNYALQVMTEEISRQVYPDGVQTEISTKTQWVALRRFESIADNFQKNKRQISEDYLRRIEEMYNYLAYAMRPDGHQPLNNDSDREDLRPRVLKAAEKFGRPDWQWIATNGKMGELPETTPTVTFPWAGIHVMRNGWQEQAHWAFFDTGPYGTGHQHRDKLHLSVAAFGKDLLVDGGRYTHQDYFSFDPTVWRGYFRSSFSHNVLLIDGKGQNAGPTRGNAPLQAQRDFLHHPRYDYAWGSFADGYEAVEGKAVHTRSVLYLRDQYWLVLDHVDTDRPRRVQALWHFAPDCAVVTEGKEAITTNPGEANLRIVPLGRVEWRAEIVSGQEKPFIQGWYSADYGIKIPNPTLVYTTDLERSGTFAWLLVPANGPVPAVQAQFQENGGLVRFSINRQGEAPANISLPVKGDAAKMMIANF